MISGAKFRTGGMGTLRAGPPAWGRTGTGWLAGLAWAQERGLGRQWPESGCILCHLMRRWASSLLCPRGSSLSGGHDFQMTEPGPGSSRTSRWVLCLGTALVHSGRPSEPGIVCTNALAPRRPDPPTPAERAPSKGRQVEPRKIEEAQVNLHPRQATGKILA